MITSNSGSSIDHSHVRGHRRHRIQTLRSPRVAPAQAASRQPHPAPGPVGLQRFQRVGRARWNVPAHRRTAGASHPDGSHCQTGQSRREPHPELPRADPHGSSHRRRRSVSSSLIIARSSSAEKRSRDADTPRRYSPPASTTDPSPASSRSASRTRRRTRFRTTAVPTDLGTARWTRVAPGAARNDTLSGPRRTLIAVGAWLLVLRPRDKPVTLPVGSVPYGVGLAGQRAHRASSFGPGSRVSCVSSLCLAEMGVS